MSIRPTPPLDPAVDEGESLYFQLDVVAWHVSRVSLESTKSQDRVCCPKSAYHETIALHNAGFERPSIGMRPRKACGILDGRAASSNGVCPPCRHAREDRPSGLPTSIQPSFGTRSPFDDAGHAWEGPGRDLLNRCHARDGRRICPPHARTNVFLCRCPDVWVTRSIEKLTLEIQFRPCDHDYMHCHVGYPRVVVQQTPKVHLRHGLCWTLSFME